MADNFTVQNIDDNFTVPKRQLSPVRSHTLRADRGFASRMMEEAIRGVKNPDLYNEIIGNINERETEQEISILNEVQQIRVAEQQHLRDAILTNEALPPEQKAEALRRIGDDTGIANHLDGMAYITAVPVSDEEHPVQTRIFQNREQLLANKRTVEQAQQEMAKQFDTDTLSALTDFATSAIPFTAGTSYYNLLKQIMPERAGLIDVILPGQALRTIKDELLRLQKGDPAEFQQFVKELSAGIEAHGGLMGDNDYQKFTMMQEVFSEVASGRITPEPGIDWDQWINNAVGLLDVVGLGGLITRGIKLGKAATTQRVDNLNRSNPRKAAEVIDDALRSDPTDASAIAMGYRNKTELAAAVNLPLPEGVTPANMPGKSHENWLKAEAVFNDLASDTSTFIHYTEAERNGIVSKAVRTLEELQGVKYFPARSTLKRDDDGLTITAMFGQTGEYGFTSAREAKRAAERMFPDEPWRIKRRDLATGDMRPNDVVSFPRVDTLANGRIAVDEFDYFIQVDKRYGFNREHLDAANLVFGEGAIGKGASIPASRFGLDPDSVFAKFMSQGGNVAFDKSKGIETKVLKLMSPFQKLRSDKSKLKVIETLEEGEGVKTYSPSELRNRGFTVKEMEGYYSIRNVMDGLHGLQNARLGREMSAAGMHRIKRGDVSVYAKPLSQEDAAGVRWVYDMETNAIRELHDVPAAYISGRQLGKAWRPVTVGQKQATHVMWSTGDRKTVVGGLPRQVLEYTPGYVTRFYDNTHYIIVKENLERDGRAVIRERAIQGVNSKREAERLVRTLKESGRFGDRSVITFETAQSAGGKARDFDFDLDQIRGQVKHGPGSGMPPLADLTGQVRVQDPLRSLTNSIGKISHSLGHADWIQSMKDRWLNTYSDLAPTQQGRAHFPRSADQINKQQGTGSRRIQAKRVWDYINDMQSIQSETSEAWLGFMADAADWVEDIIGGSKTGQSFARFLRGVERDPFQVVKGLTFDAFLTLAPLRQIVLQSQQATYLYAIDPVYVATGMAQDLVALKMGANWINRAGWDKVKPTLAKAAGMSEADYDALIRGWVDSGMDAAIDSHQLSRESFSHIAQTLNRSKWVRTAKAPMHGVQQVLNAVRAVGFDAGERLNLQQTWLISRNQWIKNNPGKNWQSKIALQEIAGQARSMSLSMTKAGALGYQRGFLSVTTQFMSVMHKATLGMLTNKTFTRSQRARIAAGQGLFYGAAGFPFLDKALEYAQEELGINLTPEQFQLVENGLAEWLLNTSIQQITGDDTNIAISEDLAPAGGVGRYVGDMAETALTMPWWEFAMGPSKSLANRTLKAAEIVSYIYQRPDMSTPEKVQKAVRSLAAIGSGYSSFMKMQATRNMGYVVSSTGDPVLEATFSESVAKLFGLDPHELDGFYDIQNEITAKTQREKMDTARQDARRYYDRMKTVVQYYRNEMPNSVDDVFYSRLEEAMKTEAMILNHVDEDYREAVLVNFREILDEGVSIREDELWQTISDLAIGNQYGTEMEHILQQMEYRGLVTTEEDKKQITELWQWFFEDHPSKATEGAINATN